MFGLVGTRVVIVDDVEKEAMPVIKSFSQKGISVTYFDGKVDYLPETPLTGVRLAILDMDIVGGNSDRTKISALVNILGHILAQENGPYTVLIWTKHVELYDGFRKFLFSKPAIPKPVSIIMISKTEYLNGEDFDIDGFKERIKKEMNQISPLEVLGVWEENSFVAATQVTNSLCNLSQIKTKDSDSWQKKWKENMLSTIHVLAKAESGRSLGPEDCIRSFYNALNPLHADKMENGTNGILEGLQNYVREVLATNITNYSLDSKAKINSMLHIVTEGQDLLNGGTIYSFSSGNVPGWVPQKEKIIDDLLQSSNNDDQRKALIMETAKNSKVVLIEVNASCDHVQKKVRIARFITGILVPDKKLSRKKVKSADYIRFMGPVNIRQYANRKPTTCNIIFSSLHLVTVDLEKIKKYKPFGRLRSQAFVDLQSWLGHQTARPGMLFLTEKME